MRDKLNQFIADLNGQFVEVSDRTNTYQCMDLAFLWVFVLGFPKATIQNLYAYQVWTNPKAITKQYFDLIPNTSDFIPQDGDITVFNKTSGNIAGHIGIALGGGTTKTFKNFEQNNPLGTNAHIQTQNYNSPPLLGVLRPKTAVIDAVSVPKADFEQLVRKSTEYDKICNKLGFDSVSNESAKIISAFENLKGELLTIKKSQETVEAENTTLREKIDTLLQNGVFSNSTGTGSNISFEQPIGPSPVPDVQPDSDNGGSSLPFPPTPSEVFWTRLVGFFKKLFAGWFK